MTLETIAGWLTGKGIIAVVGFLSGGLGVKIIDWLQSRNLQALDDAQQVRTELWAELNTLRAELNTLRHEVTEWKEKYFAVLSDYTMLEGRYNTLKDQFEIFVTELRSK